MPGPAAAPLRPASLQAVTPSVKAPSHLLSSAPGQSTKPRPPTAGTPRPAGAPDAQTVANRAAAVAVQKENCIRLAALNASKPSVPVRAPTADDLHPLRPHLLETTCRPLRPSHLRPPQ